MLIFFNRIRFPSVEISFDTIADQSEGLNMNNPQ